MQLAALFIRHLPATSTTRRRDLRRWGRSRNSMRIAHFTNLTPVLARMTLRLRLHMHQRCTECSTRHGSRQQKFHRVHKLSQLTPFEVIDFTFQASDSYILALPLKTLPRMHR